MKTLRYAVLFLTGFCTYITIEVCYRGYSYPLMGLCGGIILIVIDSINEKISWYIDILLQGIIGSFIVTGVREKCNTLAAEFLKKHDSCDCEGALCRFSVVYSLFTKKISEKCNKCGFFLSYIVGKPKIRP